MTKLALLLLIFFAFLQATCAERVDSLRISASSIVVDSVRKQRIRHAIGQDMLPTPRCPRGTTDSSHDLMQAFFKGMPSPELIVQNDGFLLTHFTEHCGCEAKISSQASTTCKDCCTWDKASDKLSILPQSDANCTWEAYSKRWKMPDEESVHPFAKTADAIVRGWSDVDLHKKFFALSRCGCTIEGLSVALGAATCTRCCVPKTASYPSFYPAKEKAHFFLNGSPCELELQTVTEGRKKASFATCRDEDRSWQVFVKQDEEGRRSEGKVLEKVDNKCRDVVRLEGLGGKGRTVCPESMGSCVITKHVGPSLAQIIKHKGEELSGKDIYHLGAAMLSGQACLHRQLGSYHADLHPENILFDSKRRKWIIIDLEPEHMMGLRDTPPPKGRYRETLAQMIANPDGKIMGRYSDEVKDGICEVLGMPKENSMFSQALSWGNKDSKLPIVAGDSEEMAVNVLRTVFCGSSEWYARDQYSPSNTDSLYIYGEGSVESPEFSMTVAQALYLLASQTCAGYAAETPTVAGLAEYLASPECSVG